MLGTLWLELSSPGIEMPVEIPKRESGEVLVREKGQTRIAISAAIQANAVTVLFMPEFVIILWLIIPPRGIFVNDRTGVVAGPCAIYVYINKKPRVFDAAVKD